MSDDDEFAGVSGGVADNARKQSEERKRRRLVDPAVKAAEADKKAADKAAKQAAAALEKAKAKAERELKAAEEKNKTPSHDIRARLKYALQNLGDEYKSTRDVERILKRFAEMPRERRKKFLDIPAVKTKREYGQRRRYETLESGLMEISEAAVKKRAEANDAKEARDEKQKERKEEQNRIADQFFSHRSNILVGLYIANKKEDHDMVDVLINKLLYESGINVSENIEVGYTPGNLYSLKADVARANKEFAVVKYTFNQFVKLHRKLSGKKSADVDPRTAEGIKFLDRIRGKWEALDSHEKREKEINKLITNLKSGVVYEHRVLFGRHRRSRRHRK